MRFLVMGLGSMGKRRIRCLKSLGHVDITGFDLRADRREEAKEKHGIKILDRCDSIDPEYDAVVVSVPPDAHLEIVRRAVAAGVPSFVEASVILEGLESLEKEALAAKVLVAPSCTLRFHPAVRAIKKIVRDEEFGGFTNFSYHSGQYLPDWHPWENVKDYYVSKRETGGAREIVPFELTWLTDVFGLPVAARGLRGATMDVGADIDDTYTIALQFQRGFGSLMVDVVSRYAVRTLTLNLERGQVVWKWDEPNIRVYDASSCRWSVRPYQVEPAHEDYNPHITEKMYVEELMAFVEAVQGKSGFPHSLSEDIGVLRVLADAERG
ncbi:MAG: Gfo/Idh/MocA family oxidoreductase [Elusimicrobia bacterium]|nr:Gfo/Idh/MocA family oxidoreductase [Elusimicrobiota bacterium]MBK8126672.1 Gfo/Idh/MocA family oxidoreductase [Elusimicrobiota bacterium]MBK9057558.1 Gfo/Idh/MocA family oxidoreductase [Elusimicrobiota bacterium]MBP8004154.1 Gfo/Idh/MocA family oxidoreductase [Elusimicrobiota bacterium]